ncbi:hypothetical protein Ahy_B10g101929 isoform A [Arachis hypogaea]|uniref:Uncharacterized protein n=1 Tax=Arachis hypogaea TaxID=3818 RepID=A0A444X0R8_ARAHY|nr:hypothetical protein Ahy_B10g101929 isoform A [Arachis hypogaea]
MGSTENGFGVIFLTAGIEVGTGNFQVIKTETKLHHPVPSFLACFGVRLKNFAKDWWWWLLLLKSLVKYSYTDYYQCVGLLK